MDSVTTDCEVETSLAVAGRSSMDSSNILKPKILKPDPKSIKNRTEFYAMEGYV